MSKHFQFAKLILEEAIKDNNIGGIESGLQKIRELAVCDKNAQFLMGEMHEKGILEHDIQKAMKFYMLAARNGHNEAAYRAGTLNEFSSKKNLKRALLYYKMAASNGHPGGCWKVGNAELKGLLGAERNIRSACKWIYLSATCASEAHPEGAYEYANMLETGVENVVYRDYHESLAMYKKAADLGHPKANMFLAQLYEKGEIENGIPPDLKVSLEYYKNAAKNGNNMACFSLSNFYLTGIDSILSADEVMAFNYMKMAARPFILIHKRLAEIEDDPSPGLKILHSNNKKLPMSAYALGYFYEIGVGCEVNREKFIEWYSVAYLNGDIRGMAKLYEHNVPLPKKKENCRVM
eukprot:NODE_97_length_21155_cov_0.234850.p4 type:complete len:350 gc:universal NODE_97_length_21155_cov_0.234850:19988-18939(-)